MRAIISHLQRLGADDSGSTAIEYGLIASVMGLMLIPFSSFFSQTFGDWGALLVDAFYTVLGI